ncbi:MAG TPA: BLUF domain-containing protein, partial [Afifellaceae bacterium]|nr:BLUF domain-containing protein [Afifellaceae bacterium]
MYCLVYVSAAHHLMGDDELTEILETSRARNAAAGITGMLLYKDGSFMQLLEGAKTNVLGTYE